MPRSLEVLLRARLREVLLRADAKWNFVTHQIIHPIRTIQPTPAYLCAANSKRDTALNRII